MTARPKRDWLCGPLPNLIHGKGRDSFWNLASGFKNYKVINCLERTIFMWHIPIVADDLLKARGKNVFALWTFWNSRGVIRQPKNIIPAAIGIPESAHNVSRCLKSWNAKIPMSSRASSIFHPLQTICMSHSLIRDWPLRQQWETETSSAAIKSFIHKSNLDVGNGKRSLGLLLGSISFLYS